MVENDSLQRAAFGDEGGKLQPRGVIMLTEAFDLPPRFDSLATVENASYGGSYVFSGLPYEGLTQFQDKSIGVAWNTWDRDAEPVDGEDRGAILAVVDPNGTVVAEYDDTNASSAPRPFDLVEERTYGYYRIEAQNGVSIPDRANGTETNINYAMSILPDAFDEHVLWLLMRGSSDLYKANYYLFEDSAPKGEAADVSRCEVAE